MFDSKTCKKLAIILLSIIILSGALNVAVFLKQENSMPENLFDKAWVDEQNCDLYLVISKDTHASTILACFEEEKTIYATTIESGAANPFPNIETYELFNGKRTENIILIADEGQSLPSELLDKYSCDFKQQISELNIFLYDVYELNPYDC